MTNYTRKRGIDRNYPVLIQGIFNRAVLGILISKTTHENIVDIVVNEHQNSHIVRKGNSLIEKRSGVELAFTNVKDYTYRVKVNPRHCIRFISWPDKLPSSLDKNYTLLSKNDIGLPSYWRIARFLINKKTKEIVYLKLMPLKYFLQNKQMYNRVKEEIQNQKKVAGPFCLKVLDDGETGDFLWCILETASYGNLRKLQQLFPDNCIPEYITKEIFYEVLQALNALHSKNITHNFLKLDKVLIGKNFVCKLSDFGFSTKHNTLIENTYDNKFLFDRHIRLAELKDAPELSNIILFTKETDIWLAGVMLFEMLFGKQPIDDININQISSECQDILGILLNKNPSKRQSTEQLLKHKWFKSIDSHLDICKNRSPKDTEANFPKNPPLTKVKQIIKKYLFTQFLLDCYKDMFYFKENVTKNDQNAQIQKFLLSHVDTFSKDQYTSWNSTLKAVSYLDISTITTDGWPNTTTIPTFKTKEYLRITSNDLLTENLPKHLLKYISQTLWDKFRKETDSFFRENGGSNMPFFDKKMKPFSYTEMETDGSKNITVLPNKLLLDSNTLIINNNINILSMPIKVTEHTSEKLNSFGRCLPDGKPFSGDHLILPIEICEPHVIRMVMASYYYELLVSKERAKKSFIYLTLRRSIVYPSSRYGVAGWHFDGAWGEQTKRHKLETFNCDSPNQGLFSDRNYLIQSSPHMKTPFANVPVNLDPIRKKAIEKYQRGEIILQPNETNAEDTLLHHYLTRNTQYPPFQPPSLTSLLDYVVEKAIKQQGEESTITLPDDNTMSFFTASAIHKVAENKSGKPIDRCAIRIAYSADYFDKANGPTINPIFGLLSEVYYYPYPSPYILSKTNTLIRQF